MTRPIPSTLTGHRLAVVDVEGNGGQPPEIVEITVLTLDEPVSRDDLSTWLVRPVQPITPLVTSKVHGIRNADVADCPTWAHRRPPGDDRRAEAVRLDTERPTPPAVATAAAAIPRPAHTTTPTRPAIKYLVRRGVPRWIST